MAEGRETGVGAARGADAGGDGETIVAISTPPGRGGIGIVRVSGPAALAVAGCVVTLRLDAQTPHALAQVTRVRDTTTGFREQGLGLRGELVGTIDEAVVTVFHAPRSYTGETLVEIAAHGAPVVLEAMVRMALEAGSSHPSGQQTPAGGPGREKGVGNREGAGAEAPESSKENMRPEAEASGYPVRAEAGARGYPVRMARAGEFTQRAFLSGRLDLMQAEAVQDLIAAQTLEQARTAAQQMGGSLSRRVAPAKERLLRLIAVLEAGMDFASGELDDVDVMPAAAIAVEIAAVTEALRALAASYARGQLRRQGAALALVGPPNAGKSSLFNRLLERERAIVTAAAGTTRDTLEETLALDGVPVRLVDTAGLRAGIREQGLGIRDGVDEAERIGMERSAEAMADADVVLVVHDASAAMTEEERVRLRALRTAGRPHVVVWNKIDLVENAAKNASEAEAPLLSQAVTDGLKPVPFKAEEGFSNEKVGPSNAGEGSPKAEGEFSNVVATSAVTGEGIAELRAAVLRALGAGGVSDGAELTSLRQREAVETALAALRAAAAANDAAMPHEVLLLDLHAALGGLDALTGQTTTEDILGRIFAAFCIGK